MYELFTDRARKVMTVANQEALRFNHEFISTEHILLGLIKEGDGVAAKVLKDFNVGLRDVRIQVEKLVPSGPELTFPAKRPQNSQAKHALEYAKDEAIKLNHNYIATEHIFLGLLREKEGVALQVLMNLGKSPEKARMEVLKRISANEAVDQSSHPKPVHFLLDPGSATADEVAELYCEISKLYRMMGGSGVRFTVTDCRLPKMSEDPA